jgi:Protein phosphatase 2C
MQVSHRIDDNRSERERLTASGGIVARLSSLHDGPAPPGAAGCGPLWLWSEQANAAGQLGFWEVALSRCIGNRRAGPLVLSVPHVRQALIPAWGCRLILASDGIWNISRAM